MNRESPGYLGPMKHKSPVYLQISGTFRAYEAQITYSRISYLFRALEVRIYWIIANLLDDCKSPGWLQISWMIANLLDDCKSPRCLGPIGRETQVRIKKTRIFLRSTRSEALRTIQRLIPVGSGLHGYGRSHECPQNPWMPPKFSGKGRQGLKSCWYSFYPCFNVFVVSCFPMNAPKILREREPRFESVLTYIFSMF